MLDDFLAHFHSNNGEEQFLWETTRARFDSLEPPARDAAYRCVVTHWFDADVIAALLGSGHLRHIGQAPEPAPPAGAPAIYATLQTLSTVEPYPDQGHAFHRLTRHTVLERLWQDEEAFVRAVSNAAAAYFDEAWQAGPEAPDSETLVEWLYHLAIADEPAAQANIDYLINDPDVIVDTGLLESILAAVGEHAAARRLSPELAQTLPLWQAQVAFRAGNAGEAQSLLSSLLAAESLPDWLRAPAALLLGDTLQAFEPEIAAGHYDSALAAYERLEAVEDQVLALVRLADTSFTREQLATARRQLLDALNRYLDLLIVPPAEELADALEGELTLDVFTPDAWHQVSFDRELDVAATGDESEWSEAEPEAIEEPGPPPSVVLYAVEPLLAEDVALPEDNPFLLIAEDDSGQTVGWPVDYSGLLAEIWLKLGQVTAASQQEYGLAASAARLGGEMALSLGDLNGAQRAAQLLHHIAGTLGDTGLRQWSVDFQEEILAMASDQGDMWTALDCLLALGGHALATADTATARARYESALALAESLPSLPAQSAAREGLARISWLEGARGRAEEQLKEALDLLPERGYDESRAWLLATLGDLTRERLHTRKARDYFQSAYDLFHQRNLRLGMGHTLARLGSLALSRFRYDEARDYLEQALDLARQEDLRATEAEVLADLAELNDIRGREEVACEQYEAAIAISNEIGLPALEARSIHGLGRMKAEMEEPESALADYQRALDIYRDIGDEDGELAVLVSIGEAQVLQKDFPAAIGSGEQALALAQRIGGRPTRANTFMALGLSQLEAGQVEDALANLQAAAALEPRDSTIIGNLGWAYYEAGDYQRSLDTCLQALDLDPDNSWHYRNIGHAYLALRRSEPAEENYRKAIALRHEGEHFKETIKVIRKLLQQQPEIPRGAEMLRLFEETQAALAAPRE
jgi:tetratricopeptide (TPR) repeat protein